MFTISTLWERWLWRFFNVTPCMLTETITFRKNVLQTGSTFNRNTVTITSRCYSPQAVTLDKSNLKKTDDDQYSWVKERIRKIPYLQYHAIRESNPRQMCHETLISYSIRSFWIILIDGISSCESLCKHDHEFNVVLPGVMKTNEYDEIEKNTTLRTNILWNYSFDIL